MAASSARHLFFLAFMAALAAAAAAWGGGGRVFFSNNAGAEAAAAVLGKITVEDPNSAAASSRPSTGGTGRGYGLYGRPEENYPPNYFRRGVHRNAEKLTTTNNGNVPVSATTAGAEDAVVPAGGGGGERAQPFPENGSGRGRPPYYYTAFRGGRQRRDDFGMSDTRLYQNGRYYYDVDAGRYGYGRESNPMRSRPESGDEELGSGYGRRGGGDRRGRYGGYGNNAAGNQYGDGDEFGSRAMDRQNGFQRNQNEQYIP